MEYKEEDYLLLSGIQHFVFCRRQWALIHIEQQWNENLRTVEGKIVHERTHNSSIKEKRGDVITSRGMAVFSAMLGISGVCDVVEFHKSSAGVKLFGVEGLFMPIPVEYKKGKPKEDSCDMLQLCAQAMCLEEMLVCKIDKGFLFYDEIKHRAEVSFTNELRSQVKNIFSEMHQLYTRRYTPKVKPSMHCKACSLVNICIPKLCNVASVDKYIKRYISEENI